MPATRNKKNRIAAVISSHGFGHAARACAILECIKTHWQNLEIEIFTKTPEWFFTDSLSSNFHYNQFTVDIGLVQKTPFVEDLQATVEGLSEMFLAPNGLTADLAKKLSATGCDLVLCDISPLGIQAAHKAGIPCLLVENFTWDWIYTGYIDREPRFNELNTMLKSIFASSDFHIQTEPVCSPRGCDFVSQPVSRRPRIPMEVTREKLRIPPDGKIILITTGGIEQKYPGLEILSAGQDNYHFVVPGGSSRIEYHRNITILPHHSDFYHPDLVFASDAVVGKLGYSTVAEVFHAGVPFGFVPRLGFRETEPLASFVTNNMGGIEIPHSDFETGIKMEYFQRLLEIPRRNRSSQNGAEEIAQFILSIPGL